MATGTRLHLRVAVFTLVAILFAAVAAPAWARVRPTTSRVSVSSAGAEVDEQSYGASTSGSGRFVAFASDATDLVKHDTNASQDVFVRDRKTHTTKRISVSSSGAQGDDDSGTPSISADGRFVAFESDATNLVKHDTNGYKDIFVYDRSTHRTTRVSVSSTGTQGELGSFDPSISADGRCVAFTSAATNLVGGDTNGYQDIFVRDRSTHRTTRVSVSSAGAQSDMASFEPSISADGMFVTFDSPASTLVGNDTNGYSDVFVRDRAARKTTRASVSSAGAEANAGSSGPTISGHGRFVAFDSAASNLVTHDTNGYSDVFLRDRTAHRTMRVSVSSNGAQGDLTSYLPSISANGRVVAFESSASNFAKHDNDGNSDIFVREVAAHRTAIVSVRTSGAQSNGTCYYPSISGDGSAVAYESNATNLVSGDNNGYGDIFIRRPL